MAKVSILTFHFSNNLGAMLQAYGLAQAIREIGHAIEIIDYRPLSIRKTCEGPLPRHPVKFFETVIFRRRIRNFRKKYLPLTRIYMDMEELKKSPPETDCIVCGSDQVWNIASPVRGFDPTFFLEFLGDNHLRRISYAACFGNGTELYPHRERICGLLSRFSNISVRDLTSQKMIRDLIGREAKHVLDPSFLVNYDPITPPPITRPPYIFAYCFRKTELSELALRLMQQKLNLPVVSVKVPFKGAKVVNPGPLQWLSLMRHANFVCTDSFHGTCFSLINKKQFVTLEFEGGMSRLEDIHQTAQIPERLIINKDQLRRVLQVPVDYKVVSLAIDKARESSIMFLRNAIQQ